MRKTIKCSNGQAFFFSLNTSAAFNYFEKTKTKLLFYIIFFIADCYSKNSELIKQFFPVLQTFKKGREFFSLIGQLEKFTISLLGIETTVNLQGGLGHVVQPFS